MCKYFVKCVSKCPSIFIAYFLDKICLLDIWTENSVEFEIQGNSIRPATVGGHNLHVKYLIYLNIFFPIWDLSALSGR